jgi:uncharacterized protein
MPALRSSNLHSVEYDPETRVMEISFKRGSIYTYADVDQGTYDSLMAAASPGAYFATNIKDKFSFTKG